MRQFPKELPCGISLGQLPKGTVSRRISRGLPKGIVPRRKSLTKLPKGAVVRTGKYDLTHMFMRIH
jgi:hypothetical protein